MKLEFPRDWGERSAFREGDLSGTAYGEVASAWRGELEGWLRAGRVPGAEDLRAGRVFRCGEIVVKFFPAASALARWLRAPAAQRSAEAYFRILPILSPRPLLAASLRADGSSLLLSEFVTGPLLKEVWHDDDRAAEALPTFLADMHRRGVYHGDLHPANLVWHEGQWVLLDVAALRTGLHALRARKLIRGQWVRLVVYLKGDERLERAFHTYHGQSNLGGDASLVWRDIQRRAEHFDRNRRVG